MNLLKSEAVKSFEAAHRELQLADEKARGLAVRLTSIEQSLERSRQGIAQRTTDLSELARGSLPLDQIEARSKQIITDRANEQAWCDQQETMRNDLVNDLASAKASVLMCERNVTAMQSALNTALFEKQLKEFAAQVKKPLVDLYRAAFNHQFFISAKTLTPGIARHSALAFVHGLWSSEAEKAIDQLIAQDPSIMGSLGETTSLPLFAQVIRASSVTDAERKAVGNNDPLASIELIAGPLRELQQANTSPSPVIVSPEEIARAAAFCNDSAKAVRDLEEKIRMLNHWLTQLKNAPMPQAGVLNSDESERKAEFTRQLKKAEIDLKAAQDRFARAKERCDSLAANRAA